MHTTSQPGNQRYSRRLGGLLFLLATLISPLFAQAQGLIRDAEIEATLKRIAAPLFKSAGISANSIEILVVNDPLLNAFVINNRAIFLHSGLIMRLQSMEMLQSVIAHELAHVTSGHIIRRAANQRSAMTAIGIGMLLSIAVSASGNTEAGAGIALGVAGGAQNNLLRHTRAEETTADQIGLQYLVFAGINPNASIDVLKIFKGQETLSIGRQDGYARTHPLSADRIRALEGLINIYGGQTKAQPTDLPQLHKRMQAKFRGFLNSPTTALRRVKADDTSESARLTRAIAYHRLPDAAKSMAEMNTLLAQHPDDAYYHELKGQFLLENGQVQSAVVAYKKAVELAPKEALILAGYGRALLSQGTRSGDKLALDVLRQARDKDPRDAQMLRDLALAWAKAGNNGMASLITAERYALLTQFQDANTNAVRAEGLLPPGSSGWLQAQDMIAATKTALKK